MLCMELCTPEFGFTEPYLLFFSGLLRSISAPDRIEWPALCKDILFYLK